SSVASVSSISEASTSSIAAATTTSPSDLPTSTPDATPSPSQTISHLASSTGASSSATQTSGIVVPPNQLNASSGPKPGAIAGGVIGAILGLLLLLVIARICYRRRLRARDDAQEAKIYPFMVDEALTNSNVNSTHRRTLSRSKPDVVNWNPEQPHFTPAGPLPGAKGQEYFGNRNYRLSSSLGKFGELGQQDNSNALGMELNPTPAPAPAPATVPVAQPQPVMKTVPNATMPSVLELARAATNKRASDMPLYNTASSYNPTSLQQPNFGARPSLESQSGGTGSSSKVSPFADKFAVEGKYEPDLDDPSVMASVASAQAPRPPRPVRPDGLELEESDVSSGPTPSPTTASAPTRVQRNSISQQGPVPTVGHTRKISNPMPIVSPRSPPIRRQPQRSVDVLPSWALVNSDGRYPAIVTSPTHTPTTSISGVTSPTGSMAGVGAGRVASSQPGRQIYPAAALPPMNRQPSLKGKRVSVAQSERAGARAQSPPTVRSPPPGAMRAQTPTARAQSPPISATLAQSPPPIVPARPAPSHKASGSTEAPPRPPRAVGPRSIPTKAPTPPSTGDSSTSTPPIVTLPLTPPRRIWAEPDVPTTPTTPALSNFPTPPRSMKSSFAEHKLKSSGSSGSVGSSSVSLNSAFGNVPTTAATSAYPDIELNGPTPVASPQVKGRALQPPPPISTGLNPTSYRHGTGTAPNGLSPITASPQSVNHPQIPTPLASSTLGSPTPLDLAQFGQAMLPGAKGIARGDSVKTTYTMSTAEGLDAHEALRRELMQGLPSAAAYGGVGGPTSPTYFPPESVSNFHSHPHPIPLPMTSKVPRPAVESWASAMVNGLPGKHVSIAPSYVSANSGRRLSEMTASGEAEWKELERQLAVNGGGDVAHIMPRNNYNNNYNGSM
ncbi:hypothetical protein FRB90_006280, partial [Tulasnella sp. 427]